MKLDFFNGGVNKKLAPHLLDKNTAVESVNVEQIDGTLRPIKNDKLTNLSLGPNPFWLESKQDFISFASDEDIYVEEIGNIVYRKDNNNNLIRDNEDIPDFSPPLVNFTIENASGYPYSYWTNGVEYSFSIAGETDSVKGIPKYTEIEGYFVLADQVSNDLYPYQKISSFKFNVGSVPPNDYISLTLLFNSSNINPWSGIKYLILFLKQPSGKFEQITFWYDPNNLTSFVIERDSLGNYKKASNYNTEHGYIDKWSETLYITFRNSIKDYYETRPTLVKLKDLETYQYAFLNPSALASGYDQTVLYKIFGGYTIPKSYFILSRSFNYYRYSPRQYGIEDFDLNSYNNYNLPNTAKFLVYHNGSLWSADGARLYYSEREFYFPPDKTFELNVEITGLATFNRKLVIFKKNSIHLLLGYNETNFELIQLESNQGCINYKTIQKFEGLLLFISDSGLCVFNGSRVKNVSYNTYGKFNFGNIKNTVIHDGKYYILTDEKIYGFDLRQGKFTEIEPERDYTKLVVGGNKLYGATNSDTYELFQGSELREFYYKTKDFTEGGLTIEKIYKDFYIDCDNPVKVQINLDNRSYIFDPVNNRNLRIPQNEKRAYKCSIEFFGSGVVREFYFISLLRKVDL